MLASNHRTLEDWPSAEPAVSLRYEMIFRHSRVLGDVVWHFFQLLLQDCQ